MNELFVSGWWVYNVKCGRNGKAHQLQEKIIENNFLPLNQRIHSATFKVEFCGTKSWSGCLCIPYKQTQWLIKNRHYFLFLYPILIMYHTLNSNCDAKYWNLSSPCQQIKHVFERYLCHIDVYFLLCLLK